jgi:hypothetical protein
MGKLKNINQEKITLICNNIELGLDFIQAAILVNFSYNQAQEIQYKIKNPITKKDREIRDKVLRAMAQFELIQLKSIKNDDKKSQGARWLLERKLPEKYDKNKIDTKDDLEKNLLIGEDDFKKE